LDVPVHSFFKVKGKVDGVREQDDALLRPMQTLLLVGAPGVAADEAALTPGALRARVHGFTADFNAGRYARVATESPALIASIEAAVGLHENEAKAAVYRLSAHAYILAAQALIHLRSEFMAVQVVKCAEEAADSAGDPILRASAIDTRVWALTRLGLFAAAETVAVAAANEIEPSMANATPEHLAAWGRL
jgi:hypothetical protein